MSRRPPRLVIVVPLEGRPRLYVHAETAEDERRLARWLRWARWDAPLPTLVAELLDRLDDELDPRDAA